MKLDRKKNIVIISRQGFVGRGLCSWLNRSGKFHVTGLSSREINLLDERQTCQILGDLPVEQASLVFLSTIGRYPVDDFSVFQRNVHMALNVTKALQCGKYHHLIFSSSACIYGRPPAELPLCEQSPLNPNGHYALSKIASEDILCSGFQHGPVSILRLPGIYGFDALQKPRNMPSLFLEKVAKGLPIQLTAGGRQKRELLYLNDLCKLMELFIEHPTHGVWNLSSGDIQTLEDMIQIAAEVTGKKPIIEHIPQDDFDIYFDLQKLQFFLKSLSPHNIDITFTPMPIAIKSMYDEYCNQRLL